MSKTKNITDHAIDYSNEINLPDWSLILQVTMADRLHWLPILYQVAMIAIFIVGVCGNALTCVVIYCQRTLHTATNYYLFNMAVSDLLVAFGILIELNWYHPFRYQVESLGDIVCKIYFFLVAALWNNSILTITALAIERFIAIWHPLFLNKENELRRVMRIIYFIWAIAIIESFPEVFTVNLIQNQGSSICFVVPTPFAKQLNGILGLVTFLIPLGIMIVMYIMVAFKVNVAESHCNYSASHIFNHRNNSSKVNKLIMALTVSFIVCWLPFFGMRVAIYTMELRHRSWIIKNWELLLMLVSFNSWFSIVLNPLLFSLMSTKFRTALKELWKTKFKRQQIKRRNRIV